MSKKSSKRESTSNKRKTLAWSRYKLWIDTENKCPLCESTLILPVGEFRNFNKEQKETFKSWSKNFQDQKHIGVISHIVSYSNLKYKKIYEDYVSEKMIRSRFGNYPFFNSSIKEKTEIKQLFKKLENKKEYENEVIENYWNKIILCYGSVNNFV